MTNTISSPYKIKYRADDGVPFASGSSSLVSDISVKENVNDAMSFQKGVPSIYAVLKENGGKYFERGMANAIGRMSSAGAYCSQLGNIYTYNEEVAEAIGGYPKGAILRYDKTYTDASGNKYTESVLVQSLEENNKNNFNEDGTLVDNVHWMIISNEPDGSKLVTDLYPDYLVLTENKTSIASKDYKVGDTIYSIPALSRDSFAAIHLGGNITGASSFYYLPAGYVSRLTPLLYIDDKQIAKAVVRSVWSITRNSAGVVTSSVYKAGYLDISFECFVKKGSALSIKVAHTPISDDDTVVPTESDYITATIDDVGIDLFPTQYVI